MTKNKRRRRYSPEFRARAVEQMKTCNNIVGLGRELKVNWRLLYRWKAEAELASAAKDQNTAAVREAGLLEENVKLKVALADKMLEANFFKGALRNIEALRQKRERNGGTAFTIKSGK